MNVVRPRGRCASEFARSLCVCVSVRWRAGAFARSGVSLRVRAVRVCARLCMRVCVWLCMRVSVRLCTRLRLCVCAVVCVRARV